MIKIFNMNTSGCQCTMLYQTLVGLYSTNVPYQRIAHTLYRIGSQSVLLLAEFRHCHAFSNTHKDNA